MKCNSITGPLSSFLVDKYSCRTAVVLSGLFFTAGYLGTAFAPNIQTTIFTLGIVAGMINSFIAVMINSFSKT
jgi:MFS family permease